MPTWNSFLVMLGLEAVAFFVGTILLLLWLIVLGKLLINDRR